MCSSICQSLDPHFISQLDVYGIALVNYTYDRSCIHTWLLLILLLIFLGSMANESPYAGSGKTYTMQPLPLRAAHDMVRLLNQPLYRNQHLKLWLSYFEIYGGKLFDLLSERRLVTS